MITKDCIVGYRNRVQNKKKVANSKEKLAKQQKNMLLSYATFCDIVNVAANTLIKLLFRGGSSNNQLETPDMKKLRDCSNLMECPKMTNADFVGVRRYHKHCNSVILPKNSRNNQYFLLIRSYQLTELLETLESVGIVGDLAIFTLINLQQMGVV